jgi:peptide/nickel transport system ATP-binding protein
MNRGKNEMRNSSSKKLLNVSNISISFVQYTQGLRRNTINIITNLTLDVSKGEIVAILGSSGSGKSLLAHAILGILPDNAILKGTMEFEDKTLNQKLKEEIRGNEISLIPQSVDFLDPLMTVSNQVIGEVKDDKDKQLKKTKQRRVFEEYGLGEEVDKLYPFQLSGGMARRVLISTALLSNPKLIIADEPTPGLDEKALKETLNYIKNMAVNGRGVILITHDINAALAVADKLAIFYSGYVIEITSSENFVGNGEKLLHPYTRALYKALPQNGFNLFESHQPLSGNVKQECIYYDRCQQSIEKCKNINPDLIELDGIRVRCHVIEKQNIK